jgi:hypothetical protein
VQIVRRSDSEGCAMRFPEYEAWIETNVQEAYGRCDEVTRAMAEAFPELRRVRGHYYCLVWGERTHWWLVTPGGAIVDPTAKQFPSGGRGVYEPWAEGTEEPSGKCPNCGGYVYGGGTACSDTCAREYGNYIMRGF